MFHGLHLKIVAYLLLLAATGAHPKRLTVMMHLARVLLMMGLTLIGGGAAIVLAASADLGESYSATRATSAVVTYVVANSHKGDNGEAPTHPAWPAESVPFDRRKIVSTVRPKSRRRNTASQDEAERRRREVWKKTSEEVDALITAHHAELPREQAKAIGAVYLRFSTRFQDSIGDQLREILRFALEQKIFIPRELVFFDLAVRGFTNARDGLDQLRVALKRKQATVLLLFSTSRLFRKQYRTLAFVDDVHNGLSIRCVFVKSGVDTNDKQRWQSILAVQAMVDQFVVTMNVANIQAAHQGLLEKRIVFGTLSYGYTGEPLPGQFTKRKKPRCRIIVDPITAAIVRQIFHWYAVDLLSLSEIIRRLNDDDSLPLPPRATGGEWTRVAVKGILRNTRYRGLWKYGVTEAVYLPAEDYTCQKLRVEPLKQIQIDELRIIADDLWYSVQVRLEQEGGNGGRKPKDGDRQSRPKLLNKILICHEHQRALYVGGGYGRMMICPSCQRLSVANRPLFSFLNRRLAVELICAKLAELCRSDEALVQDILASCQLEVEAAQKPDPHRLRQLRLQAEQVSRRITFVRRTCGDTEEDQAEAEAEIKTLQTERKGITSEILGIEAAFTRQPKMPSEEEVRELLASFEEVLGSAALDSTDPETTAMAREIILLLTGGKIELVQMGERRAQQGWLQGRFQLRLIQTLTERLTGVPTSEVDTGVEIQIDFRWPASFEAEVERAWQLYKADKSCKQIEIALGCSRTKVSRLLKIAADMHGEVLEDGRSRRARLGKCFVVSPKYQAIADDVMCLWRQDKLLGDIAAELKVDRNTVTSSIRWWHESRGLPIPDGRERRKSLMRKVSKRRRRPGDLPDDDRTSE